MGIWKKFKAGVEIGTKAKVKLYSPKARGKAVHKEPAKWEKTEAKSQRKLAKKTAKGW